jgi:hypothetical protein
LPARYNPVFRNAVGTLPLRQGVNRRAEQANGTERLSGSGIANRNAALTVTGTGRMCRAKIVVP